MKLQVQAVGCCPQCGYAKVRGQIHACVPVTLRDGTKGVLTHSRELRGERREKPWTSRTS